MTDRDLRNRVVALGMDIQLAVSEIMTQRPAYILHNQNMFAAIAQVLMDSSSYATPTIENQRFYVILFTAAAFEAGMIDADVQRNIRNVHHSLFSENEQDFETAFPIMA